MRRRCAVAGVALLATSVSGVARVSVFAQSDTLQGPDTEFAHHSSVPVLQVYSSEQSIASDNLTAPANLTFPDFLRPTIETMLQRSPTFRRQCLRIAQTPGLVVRLSTPHNPGAGGPRAWSEIGTTADGRLIANIRIQPLYRTAELIAHELEHVIEQLDGIDLRTRSSRPGSGVWHCPDGSFETVRARRIGRTVADEANPGR